MKLLRCLVGCFASCGGHHRRRGGRRSQNWEAVLMVALAFVVVVEVETVKVFGWLF